MAAALSGLVHTGGSGLLSPGRENFKASTLEEHD